MAGVIVCVALNPSVDTLFAVERLTPGAIHRPLELVRVPGGKGLNVARAAARLGADVVATGLLAGHSGRWIKEMLDGEGVCGRFICAPGETRHALSVADRATERLTEFYEPGLLAGEHEWRLLEELVKELVDGATWLTLSGSLPQGAPPEVTDRLLNTARRAGARTSLDSHGPALASAIEAGPSVVKINAREASELLGAPCDTAEQAHAAVRELRRRGGDGTVAVVTRGLDGIVAATPDGSVWTGRLDVRGPYPVGSGDAFLAGMVVGLESGRDWPAALAVALGSAGANAEQAGAGSLERARAESLASQAVVDRVA